MNTGTIKATIKKVPVLATRFGNHPATSAASNVAQVGGLPVAGVSMVAHKRHRDKANKGSN